MSFTRIWKEPKSKFTWRHVVVFIYWMITVIPMLVLIGAGKLAEIADELYGIPRQWANKDAYWHAPKAMRSEAPIFDDDWMNADRDSITRPDPPIDVVDAAIVKLEQRYRNGNPHRY